MPVTAGQAVIDIRAGTGKFLLDLEAAKGKMREFGASGGSAMAPASIALRELEGNFANNTRGAARFLAQTLGLGPALQAALPLTGGIAFGGMMTALGEKVYTFFKSIQEAPAKINNAFREMNGALALTNDELRVTNDRLSIDIAKLEGKRENTLKLALDEAKLSADRLADSLDKDIAKINGILEEQNVGFWRKVFGETGINDIQEYFGGKTGQGGMRAKMSSAKGAGEESDLLKQALGQVGQWIHDATEMAKPRQMVGVDSAGNVVNQGSMSGADETARLEILRGIQRNLRAEMEHVGLEQQGEGLRQQKSGLEGGSEQNRKDQETLLRLKEELARAEESRYKLLEKVNAEEAAELQKLSEAGEINRNTLPLVTAIYDAKRLAVYGDEMEKLTKGIEEADQKWMHLQGESRKGSDEAFTKFVEENTKKLDAYSKAIEKAASESAKLINAADSARVGHQQRMIGAGGDHGDPVGLLTAQQAPQRADIETRFQNSMKMVTNKLQEANLLKQRGLELSRLDYELQEKAAEARQKGVSDFFLDMQGRAQSAGNILYESMHSGLDRVSSEMGKLLTGQKTNFGGMVRGLGEEMVGSSVKSLAQRGLGKLGEVFGISSGGKRTGNSPADALFVQMVSAAAGGADTAGLPGLGGGGDGGFLQSIVGMAGKFGGFMASGGDVNPGMSYAVGDGGETEIFTPKTAGTITPVSKLGGGPSYHIDARGADLGAANRVARAIEAAHQSAVANSIHANVERNKRIPQRSGS